MERRARGDDNAAAAAVHRSGRSDLQRAADGERADARDRRLRAGQPAGPGDMLTCLEAARLIAERRGDEAVSDAMWAFAQRLHDLEVADAHAAST